METALKLVDVVETKELSALEKKALDYAEGINNLPAIKTQEEYLQVGTLWKIGKELLKEIDEGYKDLVRAADKLHKDLVAKRAKYYNPTDLGVRAAKKLMDNFEQEQERLRVAEQKRLEEIARKEEEERRLLEAIEAEEEAKANGLTPQEAAQEAEAIISEPVYTPPIVLPKTNFVPKVSGISFREIWSAEVIDIKALCRAVADGKVETDCVMGLVKDKDTGIISCPTLNKKAGPALNIPGVKARSRRV